MVSSIITTYSSMSVTTSSCINSDNTKITTSSRVTCTFSAAALPLKIMEFVKNKETHANLGILKITDF